MFECVCVFVCVYVKFCCKFDNNFTETFRRLKQAYGKYCMSGLSVLKRAEFRVGEDPRRGRPSTLNDDHIERVRAVIRGNSR